MSAPNYPEPMTADTPDTDAKPSVWARLHWSPESWTQTLAMMAVFGLAPLSGGAAGWVSFGVGTVGVTVVWPLLRPTPPAAGRRRL